MLNDATRNALAPLFLRLALAAILIYHGVGKIMPPNDWGAFWATNYWAKKGQPPADVIDKFGELAGKDVSEEKIAIVQERVRNFYTREAGYPPEGLQYSAAQLAVAWGELLGGVALLLGLLTRLATLGIIIIQVGAILTVTRYRGFVSLQDVGAEYNVALVAMCLALLVTGAGALSVDHRLKARRKALPAQQKVPVSV
jgi:uncharacterized membrane protein YphA (DoxX/SURF4 family)